MSPREPDVIPLIVGIFIGALGAGMCVLIGYALAAVFNGM